MRDSLPVSCERASGRLKRSFKIEALIMDLLYSRVVNPEQEAAPAADLNQSPELALSVPGMGIEESGTTLVREPLPHVIGDERQLALVFQNLLPNARRYRRNEVPPHVKLRPM